MTEIEKEIFDLKEDIIKRYNMSWEGVPDTMGLQEYAKQNFRNLIDDLITLVELNIKNKLNEK